MRNSRATYEQVARLHAENIDQGFLSSLGIPFLSLLYEAIDANDSSVLLIAEQNGRVVGFVSGSEGMRPIYRQLLCRWPRLLMALLPALFSISKIRKIVEILFLSHQNGVSLPDLPHTELLSIAVDASYRSQGIAPDLYNRLTIYFLNQGVKSFRIVVGVQLKSAHRFYSKMGASVAGRIEVHQGQASLVYIHQI